jgi:hypothetical protein
MNKETVEEAAYRRAMQLATEICETSTLHTDGDFYEGLLIGAYVGILVTNEEHFKNQNTKK